METLIGKLMPITMTVVLGMAVTHPSTWRVEIAKLQYSILKEAIKTDNWGDLSAPFRKPAHVQTSTRNAGQ